MFPAILIVTVPVDFSGAVQSKENVTPARKKQTIAPIKNNSPIVSFKGTFQLATINNKPKQTNPVSLKRDDEFEAFIAHKNITRTVTITGTHSPEGTERINSKLSNDRAAVIEKYYRGVAYENKYSLNFFIIF